MTIRKNSDIIQAFLKGETKGSVNHLQILVRNGKTVLVNYSTILAERVSDKELHYNATKYGSSTTRIQSVLLSEAQYNGFTIQQHKGIEMGTDRFPSMGMVLQ